MRLKHIVAFLLFLIFTVHAYARSNEIDDGYRANADMGFAVGVGGGSGYNHFGFSTTHGYQVKPTYLFMGGGVAVDFYSDGSGAAIPIYADVRSNLEMRLSPFVDVRFGGSPFSIKGLYFSPSAGVRIPIDRTHYGISVMMGYTLQTGKFEYYEFASESNIEDKKKMGAIHLKVGFEW